MLSEELSDMQKKKKKETNNKRKRKRQDSGRRSWLYDLDDEHQSSFTPSAPAREVLQDGMIPAWLTPTSDRSRIRSGRTPRWC